MISRVMTRVDDEVVKDAEQHIKIFLSSVDRLDKSLHFAAAAGSGTASADNANDAGSGTGSHAKKENHGGGLVSPIICVF